MANGFQNNAIFWVEVDKIKPNPYQPRKEFDESALQSLADSIKQYGVLQPLVVTRKEEQSEDGGIKVFYELVAGERRLRASKLAGLSQVPVLIRDKEDSDQEKLELAIIENLQREDLNPIDKALAFKQLHEKFNMTHAQIAQKIGKSREYVSNALRLLALPEDIQRAIANGIISEGHARPLLMLADKPEEQMTLFKEITMQKLTVREAEHIARSVATDKVRKNHIPPHLRKIERELMENLGTRVRIEQKDNQVGRVHIDFTSEDDLLHLLELVKAHKKHDLAVRPKKLESPHEDFESDTHHTSSKDKLLASLGASVAASFASQGLTEKDSGNFDKLETESEKDNDTQAQNNDLTNDSAQDSYKQEEDLDYGANFSNSTSGAHDTEHADTAEEQKFNNPEQKFSDMPIDEQIANEPANTTDFSDFNSLRTNQKPHESVFQHSFESVNNTETSTQDHVAQEPMSADSGTSELYNSDAPQGVPPNSAGIDSVNFSQEYTLSDTSVETETQNAQNNINGDGDYANAFNPSQNLEQNTNTQSIQESTGNLAQQDTAKESSEDSLSAFASKVDALLSEKKQDSGGKEHSAIYPQGKREEVKLAPETQAIEQKMQEDINMIMQNPSTTPASADSVQIEDTPRAQSESTISGDTQITSEIEQAMSTDPQSTDDLGVTFHEYKEEQDTMPGFEGETLTESQKQTLANITNPENSGFEADAKDLDTLVKESDGNILKKINTNSGTDDDLYSVKNFD